MQYPTYKVLIDIPHTAQKGGKLEWIETVASETLFTKEAAIRLYQNTIGALANYTFEGMIVRVVEYTGDGERVCCSARF